MNAKAAFASIRAVTLSLSAAAFFAAVGATAGGQEVIQNPAKPASPNAGRVLKLEETIRITDEGGKFFFQYPRDPKLAPDGSLFIYDADGLLQFDARGEFVRNFYRKGQGPGELNYVSGYGFGSAPGRVVVLNSSPEKIVWFASDGRLIKEISLARASGDFDFVSFDGTRYWLMKNVFPPRTEKPEAIDIRQVLVAASEDGEKFEETAAFINKGLMAGGAFVYQQSIALPFAGRYIFFTNTREYGISLFDCASRKVLRTMSRKYKPVKRPADQKVGAIITPDGKRYEAPGAEFLEDVSGLYEYGGKLWVATSTKDPEKGTLVDVFDLDGKYADAFWLKLRGALLGVSGKVIFVREKAEDDTIRIVGYKVVE